MSDGEQKFPQDVEEGENKVLADEKDPEDHCGGISACTRKFNCPRKI
jgi:hypothetical protein